MDLLMQHILSAFFAFVAVVLFALGVAYVVRVIWEDIRR